MAGDYVFKIASEAWEFEQIKKLNYETFVEEIPQHSANAQRTLTDVFDEENTYLLCTRGRQVLAMLAVRDKRPFSLDKKLDNLDAYLPPGRRMCEVRLLAARTSVRNSRIVRGLIAETVAYCLQNRYDMALISGFLEQVKLYQHLGFVPFGPIVGNGQARFQPMYLTPEAHAGSKSSLIVNPTAPANFLPGPTALSASVLRALTGPALSHRSREYLRLHQDTQKRLAQLVGAGGVQLFTGTGTLANDVIAGQLSLLPGTGLILSNGEFGQRLIEQAGRFGLTFDTLSLPWGQPFEERPLRDQIRRLPGLQWIWAVCCETSTGMLNDCALLKSAARDFRLHLCLDCISAIGHTPLDLRDVYLASACSSKGLRSIAGLSLVFYNHSLSRPSRPLPEYLDLYAYEQAEGVPFTIPSNLVSALWAAVEECDWSRRLSRIASLDHRLRRRLARLGLPVLVSGRNACPGVLTIPLSAPLCSRTVGDRLKEAGILISYESRYLIERNWIQICLMSEVSASGLRALDAALKRIL